jgi:hypothetical protein
MHQPSQLTRALAALPIVLPCSALAFQPLVTDDTGTQGSGGNQLETAYRESRSRLDSSSEFGRRLDLAYTRGITDNLDLFISTTRQIDPVDGWENAVMGGKWRFYENEAEQFSLALKPEVTLPRNKSAERRGLGCGRTSYAFTLIASQVTSFGEFHVNLAGERANNALDNPERKNRYRLSAAPAWAVNDHWKLALDLGVQTNPDRSRDYAMDYVELGAVYTPTEDLEFAFGVTHDVHDGPVHNDYATCGITYRFK